MTRFSSIALAVMIAPVGAHQAGHHHQHPHRPLSRHMSAAVDLVETSCSRDVEALCAPSQDFMPMQPLFRMSSASDPVMDMMTNPFAPPPMLDDISSFMDQMMSAALTLSADESSFGVVRIYTANVFEQDQGQKPAEQQQSSGEEPKEEAPEAAAPEDIIGYMLSTLLERAANPPEDTSESIDPVSLSNQIVKHGQALLAKEDQDDDRLRMARRLTEVRPEMYRETPRLPLPFGCPRSRCIMSKFQEGRTSPSCTRALSAALRTQEAEHDRVELQKKQAETFVGFTFLYFLLAVITLALMVRHFGKFHKHLRAQRELLHKIMQVVYSNPSIRAAVEKELGEDVGVVPPLPPHVLARMSGNSPRGGFAMCKSLKLAVFLVLLCVLFVNPFLVMPLLTVLMCMRCLHFSCCPPEPPVMACSCCCCAASTEDVKNGTLTKEQECCTCCKGTGVCPVSCSDCCGMNPADACTCCSEGCNCCSGGDSPGTCDLKKPLLQAKTVHHEGESMQIV